MSDASEKNEAKAEEKEARREARDERKDARDEAKTARRASRSNRESGEEQVDEAVAEDQDKGFHGVEVDPTPNENYTLEGVTSGAPTPETDDEASKTAREHLLRNKVR